MISFDRLWVTLKEQGISQYKLIKEYKISTGQLDRLRKNGNVNTYVINVTVKELAPHFPKEKTLIVRSYINKKKITEDVLDLIKSKSIEINK